MQNSAEFKEYNIRFRILSPLAIVGGQHTEDQGRMGNTG